MTKNSQLHSVTYHEVSPEHAGQRLDNYLMRELKGVPKSHIYRMLRTGEVRVNKGRVKPERRLEGGDIIRLPPLRLPAQADLGSAPLPEGLAQTLKAALLWQGQGLLCLNKPAGLAVHGGSGITVGVIEALRRLWPERPFLELVHRLDRDTSGCLLLAEQREALLQAQQLWRDGQVIKEYLALVVGRWQGGPREVDKALARTLQSKAARLVCVDEEDGKDAQTLFTPLVRYPQVTLVRAQIMTGRTHQIRVHAAHLGHPLAGDRHYGDFAANRQLRALGLKRLFLHAHILRFPWPDQPRNWHIKAPLDTPLQQLLQRLEHR
ncbi:RluA family pseudouridine synthase [Thiorhodospira sibirica]|uniref:RluA family pseudouridine synthase n=1 Tax=Thiorhodospira sibirica TaxID=154347 RepID=UPI00022C4653|nr:RluA family pseudouridine synthase [Thiorhodospira sibirica]